MAVKELLYFMPAVAKNKSPSFILLLVRLPLTSLDTLTSCLLFPASPVSVPTRFIP